MSNLIDRQAAIDALAYENIVDHMDTVYDSELHRCKRAIERILSQLPSSQPESAKRTEESAQNVSNEDLISRKMAIGAVNTALFPKINTAKEAEKALRLLPSAQPKTQLSTEDATFDCISRQAAIDALSKPHGILYPIRTIESLPSAQPEITDEQAIEHLQSTGWMQNHDREMYDMGFKEQLADDSGSYDSLLPPAQSETMYYPQVDGVTPSVIAQPERKKGKWIDDYDPVKFGQFRYKCSKCGARTVEWADNFCYQCGADMRGDNNED